MGEGAARVGVGCWAWDELEMDDPEPSGMAIGASGLEVMMSCSPRFMGMEDIGPVNDGRGLGG